MERRRILDQVPIVASYGMFLCIEMTWYIEIKQVQIVNVFASGVSQQMIENVCSHRLSGPPSLVWCYLEHPQSQHCTHSSDITWALYVATQVNQTLVGLNHSWARYSFLTAMAIAASSDINCCKWFLEQDAESMPIMDSPQHMWAMEHLFNEINSLVLYFCVPRL